MDRILIIFRKTIFSLQEEIYIQCIKTKTSSWFLLVDLLSGFSLLTTENYQKLVVKRKPVMKGTELFRAKVRSLKDSQSNPQWCSFIEF